MPFTTADSTLDPRDAEFVPMHELDEQVQSLCKSYVCQENALTVADDPKMMAGAPVALQFVGPRLGDEQLLHDVESIDAVLNG